jgi:hypothetical protein
VVLIYVQVLVNHQVALLKLINIYYSSDDEYDYIFDNIVLHVSEIVPKHVHMSLTADIDLDRPEQDHLQNTVVIDM